MSEQFEREVIDRLARMEVKQDFLIEELGEHTDDDRERFESIESGLHDLVVNDAVSKAKAQAEGARAGKKTAAGVTAALLAIAEIARAYFSG